MKYAYVFTFLTILVFGTACNGLVKNGLPKEKVEHPKLIKTIGNPRYGNVQCGIQDKAGNLWFGTTQNGLYKYDGKSFRQFLVTDGLNSNNITCILEDKDGKIWVGTDAGLCLYDGRSFTRFTTKDGLLNHSIWSILEDKTGNLWVGTRETGLYLFDGKTFINYSEYKH